MNTKVMALVVSMVLFCCSGQLAYAQTVLEGGAVPGNGCSRDTRNGQDVFICESLDGVLGLPEEEIDLTAAILLVYKEWNKDLDTEKYRGLVDRIAGDIAEEIGRNNVTSPAEKVGAISRYLSQKLAFRVVAGTMLGMTAQQHYAIGEETFFTHLLDTKEGQCMSFSFLYLAIAERLGLPLHLVHIPNHFFVRYDDGTTRFNIETLQDGEPAGDDYYVQWKSIAPALVENGVYLKDRSKREAVGLALQDVARLFSEKKQEDRSLEVMKKSLLFYPDNPEALAGLGGAYLQMYGDSAAAGQPENAAWLDEAIRLSREALAVNPDYIDALVNLGTAEMVRADYAAAAENFRKILSLQPDYGPAHQRLAAVYATTKEYGSALEHADKAAELGWPVEKSFYEEIKKNAGQRHSF